MRRPLRDQIFFPVAALLALAVIVLTGVSAWHAVEVRRSQTAQHLEAIVSALGSASYPLTDDVVRQIGAMIGGEVIVLDDDAGIRASTIERSDAFRTLLTQLPRTTQAASPPQAIRWNDRSYLLASIQRSQVRWPGTLHVLLPQEEFPVVWRRSMAAPAIVAAITLALALAIARVISGRVAKQVHQVKELFGRLAEGDFQPVVTSERDDEIRDLTVSANLLSERLRAMQQELIASQRLQLLGQLSGGLSHQLKNSIAGARLAVQLHQRRCQADDPMLQTALTQLALTEEQVMAVVSLKPDQAEPSDPEPCDLSEMMTEVVALLRPHCSHRNSTITLDVPQRMETALHSPRSLKGALLNLVQNAIEAAGSRGRIECALHANDSHVIIEIRDSGSGFTVDPRQLVEAFCTTKPEGIGLGLTIAAHAVEQEGGLLTFDRARDQTVAQIQLPLHHTGSENQATVALPADRGSHPEAKRP